MKTWVEIKTGKRYPEYGYASWFHPKNEKKVEVFIRDVHGCKTQPLSQWQQEEIPDLPKDHTLQQFRDYAAAYGVACAQEFLPCCDYSKASWARVRLSPAYPSDETVAWCQQVFDFNPRGCSVGLLEVLGHWSFDILAFEKFLTKRWGYASDAEGSMEQFMQAKFGVEAVERFVRELVDPDRRELTNANKPAEVTVVNP